MRIERLEQRLALSTGDTGRLDELAVFMQRNAMRLLSKVIAECKPRPSEVLSARDSVRQLQRKSEKMNCSFSTMRNLVKSVLQSDAHVTIFPDERFITGSAPSNLKTVQIIFSTFRDFCEHLRVPQDLRERAAVQSAFDEQRRAYHVQVLGSLLDIDVTEPSRPTRDILVAASICAPATNNAVVLHQEMAVWSEGSWDSGFATGGIWNGPDQVRKRRLSGAYVTSKLLRFEDCRVFSLEWERDRDSRCPSALHFGRHVTGELKIKIPVVSFRCPTVASSIREVFLENENGESLVRQFI